MAGVVATPLVVVIAMMSAGAGHGDYVFARLLLPWASELAGIGNYNRWHGTIVVVAGMAQCPLYGLLLAWRRAAGWAVLATHLGLVVWLFTLGNTDFGLH